MKKLVFVLVLSGCASTRHVTQLVHDIQRDTIYVSNFQYDSVYVYQSHDRDYHPAARPLELGTLEPGTLNLGTLKPDTVFVKDVSIEYKYRILRDTVLKVQHDSIPYEVTIVETKEITRPLTWFDKLCRICFGICLSGLLLLLYKFIKHFWKGGFLKL